LYDILKRAADMDSEELPDILDQSYTNLKQHLPRADVTDSASPPLAGFTDVSEIRVRSEWTSEVKKILFQKSVCHLPINLL
jgi:hypothetical protein